MVKVDTAHAWTVFWQLGNGSVCLPSSADAHKRLAQIWRTTAADLPQSARILDLACGSGAVSYELRRERPDLSIVGVDYAQIGLSRMAGVELMSGVALERLPFADHSFDGAVSQFGIEYADRRRTVPDLARVLKPGSSIALVMHHADSPVVQHNRRREVALGELTGSTVESAFLGGNREELIHAFASLRSAFADQDIIAEFGQGLGSALVQPARDRAKLWQELTDMASREREILSALANAAVANCRPWLDDLSKGFQMNAPVVIRETNDLPLAWLLRGTRT